MVTTALVDDMLMITPRMLRLHHVLCHGAAQQEGSPQIDRQDSIEVGCGDVEDGAPRDDTGVVEEDVALAEVLDTGSEKRLAVGLLAHVDLNRCRVRAGIPGDGLRACRAQLPEDICHYHPSAVLGKGTGACRTDATGRTRDDSGLAV